MKKVLLFTISGLLVCSLILNWEQFKHFQSYRRDTLSQIMINFSGPSVSISKGFKMPTPEATRTVKIGLLSQSVGALLVGIPVLDNVGIPHQYTMDIVTENQFAIAALEGHFSIKDQQALAKWVDKEGVLLNQYENHEPWRNNTLLKKVFKEIYDAMPMPTS